MTTDSNQSASLSEGSANPQTQAPFQVSWLHRLMFTQGAVDPENLLLRDAIIGEDQQASKRGLIVVADDGVVKENPHYLDKLQSYFAKHEKLPELRDVIDAPGGETCKNDNKLVDSVLKSIDKNRICRKSTVLVIGGGAVLDGPARTATWMPAGRRRR